MTKWPVPVCGGQNLKRPNVEWSIFRNVEISNFKVMKVELFDFSIFEFIFHFYICLNFQNTQSIVYFIKLEIGNLWNFLNRKFSKLKFLRIFWILNNGNFWNFTISSRQISRIYLIWKTRIWLWKFANFVIVCSIFRNFEISNIEVMKVVLFDFCISEFFIYFYICLNF